MSLSGPLWDRRRLEGHPPRRSDPKASSASPGVGVAGCISVAIDVETLLRRVVAEVFDADVDATYSTEPNDSHMHRVRLTTADGQRHAGLRASYEWFDADIFDLGVSTFLLDYDDEEVGQGSGAPGAGAGRPRIPSR